MPRSGNSANDGSGREALAMAHTAMATSRSMNVSPSFFRVPSLNKLAQLSTSRDGERSSSRPHGLTPKAHLAASERRRIRAMEQGYGARGQRAASDSGGSAGSFGIMGFDAPTGAEVSDKSTALLNAADEDRSLLALDMEEGPAKHEGTTGMLKSVFNLANTTVGAGTLALPYFFSQAGLGLGCSLLFSIALLSCYSLHLLSRCRSCDAVLAANGGAAASSYLDVAFFAFERKGRIVVTLVMLCLCFGALVAYFVIIGTLLEQVVATIVSHASLQSFADALTQRKLHWLLESEFLQVCAMVFPIAPLGSLKNLSSLSIVSLLSLLAIAYLIGLVCQVRDSFMYRYISHESCSQFDSLPLTYLTSSASCARTASGRWSPGRRRAPASFWTAKRSSTRFRRWASPSRTRCATSIRGARTRRARAQRAALDAPRLSSFISFVCAAEISHALSRSLSL